MKLSSFLQNRSVFTREELAEYLSSHHTLSARTLEYSLAGPRKSGRIKQIRRGLYAVVPAGVDAGSYPVDPYLVAAKLAPGAVLAFHTALELHGFAYHVFESFTYQALQPVQPFTYQNHTFRGVKFPPALSRRQAGNFEVETVDRRGMDIRVTSRERTLVDVLSRPDLSGGWEEIWRSLEAVNSLELDRVVAYTLLLGNATTAAKVGFYLEQHRDSLMVSDTQLNTLCQLRPRQPHYMERRQRGTGRLVQRWNLIVPEAVINRSWQEVL